MLTVEEAQTSHETADWLPSTWIGAHSGYSVPDTLPDVVANAT